MDLMWFSLVISNTILGFGPTQAHELYRDLIPNGYIVSSPCYDEENWSGVGHLQASGGGELNVFGKDFLQEGLKWTPRLCMLDSDGDGRSNGEELGDPDCKWQVGEIPSRTTNITHPGMAEEVPANCKFRENTSRYYLTRKPCSAMNEQGVLYFDAVFPRTEIPGKTTSYYCKTFALPDDRDYHVVATEPVIGNPSVVHHMDLYACADLENRKLDMEHNPFECMMGAECTEMIAGWALGEGGMCTNKECGIRFGKTRFKFIRLQIHWNNEKAERGIFDESGLRLYFTPNLRPNDLGQLISAQLYLRIPPGQKRVPTYPAICSSECTKSFLPHPIHVTRINLHMHFAGKSINLDLYRGGIRQRTLARDNIFNYNKPVRFVYDPPLQINPGDELRTQCVYHSEDRTNMTYDGYGAHQEMCIAFLYYYPRVPESGLKCANLERHSYCELEETEGFSYLYTHKYGSCDMHEFDKAGYVDNVLNACGYYPETCTEHCKRHVDVMFNHDCLQGILGDHFHEAKRRQDIAIATSVWQAKDRCSKHVEIERNSQVVLSPLTQVMLISSLLSQILGSS